MTPYLLFSLDGVRYAVDARSVREIIWLPELTPDAEAPPHIAGVVNIRGRIEPVMDLGLRLGLPARRCRTSDCVVMLQEGGMSTGLIVSEVSDVAGIADAAIEPPPHYDGAAPEHARFHAGNAKINEEIVMLLDVPRLIHAPPSPSAAQAAQPSYFCPEATGEERELFHGRACSLVQTAETAEAAELVPLSIIQLGEERFGVELEMVREFSRLRRVTAIPCCPPHIAGNMNLRGDLLTLADIRSLLNIPTESAAEEVMVIEDGELSVGIPVDRVLEVLYLRPSGITPMPAASNERKDEYCKGALPYGEGMVSILDMRKILTKGGLEVEEEA